MKKTKTEDHNKIYPELFQKIKEANPLFFDCAEVFEDSYYKLIETKSQSNPQSFFVVKSKYGVAKFVLDRETNIIGEYIY